MMHSNEIQNDSLDREEKARAAYLAHFQSSTRSSSHVSLNTNLKCIRYRFSIGFKSIEMKPKKEREKKNPIYIIFDFVNGCINYL